MKQKIIESIQIPANVSCTFENRTLKCKSGSAEVSKEIHIPKVEVHIKNNEIVFECQKGNKIQYKKIKSFIAHLKNIFAGVQNKFIYKLEVCNVHFPMSLKTEGSKLLITNFLGEKNPRFAIIIKEVSVEIKGQHITVSSHNKEAAGQTAANIEKATKVRNRDRRIYQDGIFIVEKPGRNN
ncbi:MAG: 50S ribosomal protein L6 [Nanoarchaeota archaeon]|nr:50S ribosomal protein L6 [Nanoarchaeota archaeon]